MATIDRLNELGSTITKLKNIDRDKLLRPTLGVESLESFAPELDLLLKNSDFVLSYASEVNDAYVSQMNSALTQMFQQLNEQANRNNPEYVTQRQTFLTNFKNIQEQFLNSWPFFITAAIQARGFLDDEGIKKEYQKTIKLLEDKASATLQQLQEQSTKAIEDAKVLAENIENKARQTATHISVKDAQEQFKEAQGDYNSQVKWWTALSGVAVVLFIFLALYLERSKIDVNGTGTVIYYTAIRLTALTAVGAVATYCLKILRAHMHMKQLNMHRQRVANSINSFVESAVTPEQRDMILMHLVDSIISFGQSGLLTDHDDSVSPAKLAIDTVTRNVTTGNK